MKIAAAAAAALARSQTVDRITRTQCDGMDFFQSKSNDAHARAFFRTCLPRAAAGSRPRCLLQPICHLWRRQQQTGRWRQSTCNRYSSARTRTHPLPGWLGSSRDCVCVRVRVNVNDATGKHTRTHNMAAAAKGPSAGIARRMGTDFSHNTDKRQQQQQLVCALTGPCGDARARNAPDAVRCCCRCCCAVVALAAALQIVLYGQRTMVANSNNGRTCEAMPTTVQTIWPYASKLTHT